MSAREDMMDAGLSGSRAQRQHDQSLSGQMLGRRTRETEAVPTRSRVGRRVGRSSSASSQNSGDRQAQRLNLPRTVEVGSGRKYTVDILDYGTIMPHELWSTKRAIFPNGFKSRVRYWSVVEPTVWCNYICKILDAGLMSPLFMVYVEDHPCEVFVHLSPYRCWGLVIERVNELNKCFYQDKKKRGTPINPHHVQKPWSIDAHEMFGLSAPPVLQALEVLDRERVSTVYWDFKNKPVLVRAPGVAAAPVQQPNPLLRRAASDAPVHNNPYPMIQELFRKGTPEELRALETVLRDATPGSNVYAVLLLSEEIRSRFTLY